MKPRNVLLVVIIVILVGSTYIAAQDNEKRTGIGVSLGKEISGVEDGESWTLLDFPTIHMPIQTSSFRFEPEVGYFRYSRSRNSSEWKSSIFAFRLGLFALRSKSKVNLYYGGRFGLAYSSDSYEGDYDSEDDSRRAFYICPAFGGEYFFSDHFSFGGEAQLNFIIYDEEGDSSAWTMMSKTLFLVRWYF